MSNVRRPSSNLNAKNGHKGGKNPNASVGGRKSALLLDYVDQHVSIITNDGRNFIGNMKGFDQVCNVIIEKCSERVFAIDVGVQIVPLGLYVIRGDNIAIVGDIDPEKDKQMAWSSVKAPPMKPVVH